MKNLLFSLFLFFSVACQAQLYVSNSCSIYNKGTLLYVKGNVELNGNGNLYLRNGGQLLQGTTSTSTNKGTGKLSVFQEGTVTNFFYNYWCSPVGEATTTSGNGDFGATMLHVPLTKTSSAAATMDGATLDGVSGTGTLSIATYWIWRFLASANYSQWHFSGADTNIGPGQGFTMKGTSGVDLTDVGESTVNNYGSRQRYDFRGKPNDGTISVAVAANGFTLTGNPYPSALHVNAFLLDTDNSACDGIAYYWEQDKSVNSHVLMDYQGGYGTYSPISLMSSGIYVPATYNTYNADGSPNTTGVSSGLDIQRKFAPIGQGFMVKGMVNGILLLKNQHRYYIQEGDSSQFHRHNNALPTAEVSDVPQIRLNTIMNNQYTSQIALAFVSTATDGVDNGIDAKSPVSDTMPNEVYFFLENERYVIQGVTFDIEKRIPIGVRSAGNTSFKFDASQIVNFDASQPIYLYDSEDDSYHDIKNNTYEVVLPSGTYNDRFQMVFRDTASLGINGIASDFVVFQNNNAQLLTVSNPNHIAIKSIALYDLNGKQVFSKSGFAVQESYQFSTGGLSDGVYLTEIVSDNGRKVQKVLISSL